VRRPPEIATSIVTSGYSGFAFDRTITPALELDPDCTVRFEIEDDNWERLRDGAAMDELPGVNRVTGPVAIRNARSGDALRIDIIAVELTRVWAAWMPDFGPLGDRTSRVQVKELAIENEYVRLDAQLTVPLQPMIGCIGVAPAQGTASTVRPVYKTGGNLDLREMSPGATLWLPVEVEGALLSLGDLHAAMGPAEPTFVSLEASGSATVHINLERERALPSPRLRVGNETICVGMGETHAEAKQEAVDQAFALLTDEFGLEPFLAYMYASARVGLRLGGPAGTRIAGLQAVLATVPDPK
jgi:amidase